MPILQGVPLEGGHEQRASTSKGLNLSNRASFKGSSRVGVGALIIGIGFAGKVVVEAQQGTILEASILICEAEASNHRRTTWTNTQGAH